MAVAAAAGSRSTASTRSPGAASAASMAMLALPAPTSQRTPRSGRSRWPSTTERTSGLVIIPARWANAAVGRPPGRPPGATGAAGWASTTTDRWSKAPAASEAMSASRVTVSPGSPSRVATTTSWWCAPWLISAAPTASGGAAGPQSTAAVAAPATSAAARAAGPLWQLATDGVVPRQAEPGEGQGHRRRRRVHHEAVGAEAGGEGAGDAVEARVARRQHAHRAPVLVECVKRAEAGAHRPRCGRPATSGRRPRRAGSRRRPGGSPRQRRRPLPGRPDGRPAGRPRGSGRGGQPPTTAPEMSRPDGGPASRAIARQCPSPVAVHRAPSADRSSEVPSRV